MEGILNAAVLGIVEGLTEYLPVSSTGHLILVGELLGLSDDRAHVFEVFIQLGSILAVLFLYPQRFAGLFDFAPSSDGFRGKAAILKLGLVSLPALAAGFLFHKTIKASLFGPLPVAVALIVGGIVLLFVERLLPDRKTTAIESISYGQCLGIGLFQCLSLWPGMSRSGSTIVGGLICGLDRITAAQFSFLAAVPIMCAAVGYDMLKHRELLSLADLPLFATGFVVAFAAALLAIRFMVALLGRFSLCPFGIYRIILGCLVLSLL